MSRAAPGRLSRIRKAEGPFAMSASSFSQLDVMARFDRVSDGKV
jgi:hypothetical protein